MTLMTQTENKISALIKTWKKAGSEKEDNEKFELPDLSAYDNLLFSAGPHYYYIFNVNKAKLEYVHPTVYDVIGCKAEDFTVDYFYNALHPEDQEAIHRKEKAIVEFLYNRITPKEITDYKVSYTFRIKHNITNQYHTFHHQVITLSLNNGKLQYTLGVHTDITHLTRRIDDRISFINTNGGESFLSLGTNEQNFLSPVNNKVVSEREREIVDLLSRGFASKQIGHQLNLSPHTIDTYRRNLLKRFKCKNTLELTVRLLRMGVI